MRRFVSITLFLATVLAPAASGKTADLHGSGQRVVDGDEFMLCEGSKCVDVRLCGIDTPSAGRVGYADTIAALTKLVLNQEVVCRPVGEGTACDGRTDPLSRGRTVAQCFVQQATVDVAGSLVSAGFGCDRTEHSAGYYSKGHPDWECANWAPRQQ